MTGMECPAHGAELEYGGQYGAPGIGWAGTCPVDGREWAVVGGAVYDPEEGAHVPGPEYYR